MAYQHPPAPIEDPNIAIDDEVVSQDIHLAEGGEITYRTKLRVSFKYESGE